MDVSKQVDLKAVQQLCAASLEPLRKVFSERCRFTLLIRDPQIEDSDFIWTTDEDLCGVSKSIGKFAPLEVIQTGIDAGFLPDDERPANNEAY